MSCFSLLLILFPIAFSSLFQYLWFVDMDFGILQSQMILLSLPLISQLSSLLHWHFILLYLDFGLSYPIPLAQILMHWHWDWMDLNLTSLILQSQFNQPLLLSFNRLSKVVKVTCFFISFLYLNQSFLNLCLIPFIPLLSFIVFDQELKAF